MSHRDRSDVAETKALLARKQKGANFRCFSVRCSPPVPVSQNVLKKRDGSDIVSHRGQVRCRRNRCLLARKQRGQTSAVFRTLQPTCPGFSERPGEKEHGEKEQVRYCSRASDSESNTNSANMATRAAGRCWDASTSGRSRFLRNAGHSKARARLLLRSWITFRSRRRFNI
jgi:hypothetical protein